MFVHLHNHSHYSILEWLPKPKEYIKKALDLWMKAVALTDTSNIHGCHELYKEAKNAGIKPILWSEIYVSSILDEKFSHKLVLLAKSLKWYQNIIALTSKASLDNPGTQSKIFFKDLVELKEKVLDLEIVCLSWPISWEIPFFILSGKKDEEIFDRIKDYQNIFWEENYFIELLYHDDIPRQNFVTDELIRIAKKFEIQTVACNNCYYISKEDKTTQDIIMAMGTWHEIENPDRPTMINWDYSFLTEEEMQTLFWFIPEALENTSKIADMVNIEIETWWILIPVFELPEDHQKIYEEALEFEKDDYEKVWIKKLTSDEWYLRYLSFAWLNWRYDAWISRETIFKLVQKLDKPSLDKKLTDTSPEELKALSLTYYSEEKREILKTLSQDIQDKIERVEYELVVVHEMWFDAYFLIVSDYINWARNNWVPVWPWRWSAAWSLMAYLSWITDIDPLPYKLLFERFLNPARVSMPDIDTDFADSGRDKVVEYCRKKYWADHVAQICTFGTFAARAAVKDVWRVMWIPFQEMNELAKLIPEKPGTKLKWALEDSVEFKEAYNNNSKYREIIDNALKIEWNVRQIWVHACAVIIAPKPMTNFTALQHPPKDSESIVTQYSAYPLEDLWLLKMDFLWLRNLTIIKRAQKIIKNNKWFDVDILKIDLNQKEVLDIFCAWDTTWVFQFESDWMRKYLIDLAPDKFEDLIAMVSLYRPGPLAYIPTYVDVKHWRKQIQYLTPELRQKLEEKWYSNEEIEEEWRKLIEDLWPILDITYWIAVYQEQLMFLVQYMAWFSLWEADLLRRWVWKKKIEVIEALKKEFIEKWEKFRNYKPETTDYIYTEMIMPAANYSFNKSHAACYAFIAYQTAYLKAYYRTEFLTSLMVSDEENMDRVILEVAECESKWISVLPPSVNESMKHFTYIDDKNIRFWLKALKWVWDWPIDKIIEVRGTLWRNFENLEEFINLCWKEVINKKSLEALIWSWAMDTLWVRKQMIDSIDAMIKYSRRNEKEKNSSQMWLFDWLDDFEDKLELVQTKEYSYEEKLLKEKEILWIFVSGHPLDWLKTYCTKRSRNTKKMKMSFDKLEELDRKENPEKYFSEEEKLKQSEQEVSGEKKTLKKEYKEEIVQTVWYITDYRKVMTKTGKTMWFLKCEWFDFDFEVVIFPKDIEKFQEKLAPHQLVIITWALDINLEYKRKSIRAKDLKIASISTVREQARDLWIFDGSKRFINNSLNEIKEEDSISSEKVENNDSSCIILPENFEEKLDKKIWENSWVKITEFILKIPTTAKKEDLLILKNFLEQEEKWEIEIILDLRWQTKTTNIFVKDLSNLKAWSEKIWK